ncbi:MAG: glycosyltransferase family 2 protein [Bacteriovoracaceae bacterium]
MRGVNLKVSVIIPCYNEEENIAQTIQAIVNVLETVCSFEIIAVNDGSKDGTWNVLLSLIQKFSSVKAINFMTNFGQSAAYQAGIDVATGEYVLTISADFETDPAHLVTVIKYLDEGYDFVNTNRVNRWVANASDQEGFSLKNLKSSLANKLIEKISNVKVSDRGSGMKGMRAIIAKNIKFYTEMHRFIPDYASLYGAKIIEFDVDFQDRQFGASAYLGQNRTLRVILDLITLAFMLNFSKKPFKAAPGRLLGLSGLTMLSTGFLSFIYLMIIKLMGYNIGQRPLLIISVLLIILGFLAITMGVIGELLMRVYFESSGRKTYMVRELK